MVYQPGDVVLLPFPFRDRLAESARPAVVISTVQYNRSGDVVVAAITTHPPRGGNDVQLAHWANANLKAPPSTVRMLLATVAHARIVLAIGRLDPADWSAVQVQLPAVMAIP